MPELYEGQSEVVAGKLRELELLQAADEETLKATQDPAARSALLTRMAGRAGAITSQRRFLGKLTGEETAEPANRTETVRLRLTPAEKARLQEVATEAGETISGYLRGMLGL